MAGRQTGSYVAAALVLGLTAACTLTPRAAPAPTSLPSPHAPSSGTPAPSSRTTWELRELDHPAGVRVLDAAGQVLATFTTGARTVTLRGPLRVFAEPAMTPATVRSRTWVRLLPHPFRGRVDRSWLEAALADRSPDVLAIAMEYVTGAPPQRDASGLVISGDAEFGPLQSDGLRSEGADFNDYLGVSWPYPGKADPPERAERGALDCSGFIRMVYGYRSGYPLSRGPSTSALPRVAVVMMTQGPGVVIARDRGTPPSPRRLAPGDLLFFDNTEGDGVAFNHSGIYLGRDSFGAPRFLSSRALVNGPSMGDAGGNSVLTGSGIYALSWRSARRI